MRFLFTVILILLSSNTFASKFDLPEDINDPGADIPSVGSSFFDKLFSKTVPSGQTVYAVPHTAAEILAKIESQGTVADYALFPFSRSLQRPTDLTFDPLLNPRLVAGATFSSIGLHDVNPVLPMNIFIGYSKPKDEMEVISFNHEAGRYEFQIVTDVSSSPKVYYADRSKCFACHQNLSGIFPEPSWDDSSFAVGGTLMFAKMGLPDDAENSSTPKAAAISFGGNFSSDRSIGSLDTTVRFANFKTNEQRIWLYYCGADTRCRLGIILGNLAHTAASAQKDIDYAVQVVKQRPLLLAYQPVFSSQTIAFGLQNIVGDYKSVEEAVNDPNALLRMIGVYYNLVPNENPAIRNPPARAIGGFAEFMAHREFIKEISDDQIATALIDLYQNKSALFEQRPINPVEVMAAILTKLKSSKLAYYTPWLNRPTPAKVLFTGDLPPVFQDPNLTLFARHCAKCHASSATYPAQFLFGSEAEVVTKIAAIKDKILSKLENNLMPPSIADRDFLKSTGDYDRLVKYLKGVN